MKKMFAGILLVVGCVLATLVSAIVLRGALFTWEDTGANDLKYWLRCCATMLIPPFTVILLIVTAVYWAVDVA